jgi:hypothetical protein
MFCWAGEMGRIVDDAGCVGGESGVCKDAGSEVGGSSYSSGLMAGRGKDEGDSNEGSTGGGGGDTVETGESWSSVSSS